MKFRIRHCGSRCVVELPQGTDATLTDLRNAVCEKFALSKPSFDLSLNGKDAVVGDHLTLMSAGIVDGDLVHVILKEPAHETVRFHKKTTTVCAADPHLLSQMMEMGFSKDQSAQALLSTGNISIEKALELLLQQPTPSGEPSTSSDHKTDSNATTSESSAAQGTTDMDQEREAEDIAPYKDEKTIFPSSKPRTLLCRDGIPGILQELYGAADVITVHDAVLVVVHVLMLETGYFPLPNQQTTQAETAEAECHPSQLTLLPVDWNKGPVQRFCYVHPACPAICLSITCTSLGPYILVHGLADSIQSSHIFQSKLLAADFVRGSVDLTHKGASSVYRNLHRMSRIIKDQIAYPLLSFARSELGLPELYGFMALPTEIKFVVLRCLPVETILQVSCTCRELHLLTSDPCLWQFLSYRDFGMTVTGRNISWKTEYRRRHEAKKSQDRARMRADRVAIPRTTDPTFGPFMPYCPPGIIGGRSDLFPDMPFMPGGFQPFPRNVHVPRPRFDPFGPSPNSDNLPPSGRGRGRNARGFNAFHPRFL